MNHRKEQGADLFEGSPRTREDDASDTYFQRLHGQWTPSDQTAFELRLEKDPEYADAYRRVDDSWAALERHAEAPELMAYREEALSFVRRANARRWLKPNLYAQGRWPNFQWKTAAAVAGVAVLLATVWQFSPYGYKPGQYRTGIGEQRMVELADHSRIALDAATTIQVRFSSDGRVVQLKEGQAQFMVAHDPTRPFKVQVGDQTVVALGTIFTVEYVDHKVHVAMMEGRVAYVPQQSSIPSPPSGGASNPTPVSSAIELSAGEELHVARNGHTIVTRKADLEAATAWREGKVIFRTETLSEAARRLNRYSQVQIEIDESVLAAKHINGVFEAGDTQGFITAVQRYWPVKADYSDRGTVRLSPK